MIDQISVAPLLIEWVLLVTVGAPLVLSNRKFLQRRPRLGLMLWFTLLLSAFLAAIGAIELGFLFVFELWLQLGTTSAGLANLAIVIFQSLAPWVLLAAASGVLVLVSTRLEPITEQAASIKSALSDSLVPNHIFEGVAVSWVAVPVPLAFVTRIEGKPRIVISTAAKELLSEAELQAVLWHELGHIWGSHNLLRRIAYLVKTLTPRLPVSASMVANVELLCELEADGFAVTKVKPEDLASARAKFAF